MTNPKCFVSITSEDPLVQKLHSQIEKSFHLGMWVAKAIALLERYQRNLNQLDHEKDPVRRGGLMEDCEASFMSSVIHFHRCFVDQPTMHLQIEQVTSDSQHRSTYDELLRLRNDEFIHWKGDRSKISVRYSIEEVSPTILKLADEISGDFSYSIGLGFDLAPLKQLYLLTGNYIETRRNGAVEKLRSHLSRHEVLLKSQFLNENGEPLLLRENPSEG